MLESHHWVHDCTVFSGFVVDLHVFEMLWCVASIYYTYLSPYKLHYIYKWLLLWPGFVSSFINFIWLSVSPLQVLFTLCTFPCIFIRCTYHQVEDQGGVDNDGFEQELEVTIFGFISQTVQFLVAAPVSREQLWLLITAAGLEEGITETEGVTAELTGCALKQCEHKVIWIPLWQTQRGVTVWLVPSGTTLC